jgi:hypothetical protein
MDTLSANLDYFIANQDALVHQYAGRVLVLKDGTVAGDYDSPLAAYNDASIRFLPGTFSIQSCNPGVEAYTVFLTPQQLLAQ